MSVLQNGLFGCLVTHRPGEQVGFNGLQSANQSFLKAVIRYSQFSELHLFLAPHDLDIFQKEWQPYFDTYGADKIIRLISVSHLPGYFSQYHYAVFHAGDPYISDLVALRDHHSPRLFPVVGRAHTLSDDSRLSRMRDLVMSPIKNCDAILCSSSSQKQVLKRLLSTASASISDSLGIALPYRGRLEELPLGLEPDAESEEEKLAARSALRLPEDKKIILCLGRLSPSDKMDLHPLLLALNDLLEDRHVDDFLLVIAGGGDAGGAYVQSLLKRAYELNLEELVRFELSVDEVKKHRLYRAADIFVSLADNVQESFGLTPLEAMRDEVPVVLSDWDGYRELVEDGVSGCLISTVTVDNDDISRSLSMLQPVQARLLEAQSVAVDINALVNSLYLLLTDKQARKQMAKAGRQRFAECFTWPGIIADYQTVVERLGREAASVSYRPGRPSGMSYHHVFSHYASSQLEPEQKLVATDRGLRVLLQSEHGFHFSELNEWLDQSRVYELLEKTVQPVTVQALSDNYPQDKTVSFTLAWMMKYQLLQVADGAKSGNGWVKAVRRFDAGRDYGLTYPEQRRAPLLQSVLMPCMEVLTSIVGEAKNRDALLRNFGDHLVQMLDEAVLQAVGWFARRREMRAYGEVLEALDAEGGMDFLIREYPLWYHSHRRRVFRYLRSLKALLRRSGQDLEAINATFKSNWQQQASALSGVRFFGHHKHNSVYLLQFDNGEQLVYKARDLRIDQALAGHKGTLVSGVNRWLSSVSIATHEFLCRQESIAGRERHYGYVQFLEGAEQGQDLSVVETGNYFRHAGALLAFSLVTGLADLHPQNLVSHNGMLYLVDVETAFHRGLLQRVLSEVRYPERSFLRGLDGSSFEETELYRIWQDFWVSELNHCSVRLVNGELFDADPVKTVSVLRHLLKVNGQHCLDENSGCNVTQLTDELLAGFAEVVEATGRHADEFESLLSGLRGYRVRYQPFVNLAEYRKILHDLFTSPVLQQLSKERVEVYIQRLIRRLTLSGEVSQKWLEPEWQERVSLLGQNMASSCLKLEVPVFGGELGCRSVALTGVDDFSKIETEYFKRDALQHVADILGELKKQDVRAQFIESYQSMLRRWLSQVYSAKDGEGWGV